MSRSRALFALALCALFVALLAPRAPAQSGREARVRALLSTGVVRFGDAVTLKVTVENAGTARVRGLPEVDGLRIGPVGAPSRSQMIQTFNGRSTVTRETGWSIPVRPLEPGDFEIPPLELEVDGRVERTQPLALTVVEDLRGEDLGYFEISASSRTVVEGQPFSIELRFGWDEGLESRVNFANLSLPWWDSLAGVLPMEEPAARPGVQQVELILNTRQRVAVDQIEPQLVRGRRFRSFRLLRSFTPTRSGTLEFPISFLEFGRVEDRGFFSRGNRKLESYFVRAAPLEVEVLALPEEGRPLDYGGAIGTLAVRASAEPRDVDAGESIKLTLEVSGAGNLEFFTAPDPSRLEAFEGFRYFGKTEEKGFERRSIEYDVAPLSSASTEIPPLRLPVFDPEQERYVVLETDPIPIRVRALENAVALSDGGRGRSFERDLRDIESSPGRGTDGLSRPGWRKAAGAIAALPFLWLGLRGLRRRREDLARPVERRRRHARAELARALAAGGSAKDRLDALHEFLAARTREAPGAWVGRDALAWCESGAAPATWSTDAAREVAELVAALEAVSYGGAAANVDDARLLAVVDRSLQEGL